MPERPPSPTPHPPMCAAHRTAVNACQKCVREARYIGFALVVGPFVCLLLVYLFGA